MLVAAMLTFAVDIRPALLETAIGERIASETGVAVGGGDASDAAMTRGLAARETGSRAIRVAGALRAHAIRTMKLRGAGRDVATGRLLPAPAPEIRGASAASRGGAAAASSP
jgi:hypothetical protein